MPAIHTTAISNVPLNTALGGHIFQEEAKNANGKPYSTFPYMVFKQSDDRVVWTYNTESADVFIDMQIYDKASGPANMHTLITKLHEAFDDIALAISNWSNIRVERSIHILLPPDEQSVRQSTTEYKFMLQKG